MSTAATYKTNAAPSGRGRFLSFPFINIPLEVVILGILLIAILGIIAIIG